MPEKRSPFKSEMERYKRRFKIWLWLITLIIWVAVAIGAVLLLVKLIELVLVKLGF